MSPAGLVLSIIWVTHPATRAAKAGTVAVFHGPFISNRLRSIAICIPSADPCTVWGHRLHKRMQLHVKHEVVLDPNKPAISILET